MHGISSGRKLPTFFLSSDSFIMAPTGRGRGGKSPGKKIPPSLSLRADPLSAVKTWSPRPSCCSLATIGGSCCCCWCPAIYSSGSLSPCLPLTPSLSLSLPLTLSLLLPLSLSFSAWLLLSKCNNECAPPHPSFYKYQPMCRYSYSSAPPHNHTRIKSVIFDSLSMQ